MDYYRCPKTELHQELCRRGLRASGDQDIAAERLSKDDEDRGSEATTVSAITWPLASPSPWKINPEFGTTTPVGMLVNESIIYWTMNTFFPTLHLFFESGRSCNIEGTHLPGARVGLDPTLRSRLTDLTHEEDGRLVNTIIPKKLVPRPSIRILEAKVACRYSIAVKETHQVRSGRPVTTIVEEQHVAIGLRLQGMTSMAYVWAKVPRSTVEVAGRMASLSGIKWMCFPRKGRVFLSPA
ncbi:hypothetical protein BU23DRAFT_552545 [Bimuria novae-zelandiae CBS 107.79]|uniref:Uncharacterized protein n=1 Tax=Bimuria novae-zelandiae CBS 107.79 TaxID=1447943 RepID=A0A6A5VGX2_9PLEO|nr:hypothetical protein BU23DRAFT_552545 [Bimuria novae-zelandiae CBS 107.79]